MKGKSTWVLGTVALVSACGGAKEEAPRQYNILIIEADDHTQQMLSAYDSRHIQTPNMDHIAEGGVRFENSFVANSISGPSRACLLTGKHSHKNGFTNNIDSYFDGSQVTFPKLLQQAGYETAIVGKWHLHSMPTGFDFWEILPGQGDYYNPDFIQMDESRKQYQGYVTDIIADMGISWLEQREDKERPFLLMIQHKAAHRDWLPRLEDLDKYEDQVFVKPDNFFDDYEGRIAAGAQEMNIYRDMDPAYDVKMESPNYDSPLASNYRHLVGRLGEEDQKIYRDFYEPLSQQYWSADWTEEERAEWHFQRYMRDYAKVVYAMDESIGRVMDYLEEQGLLDTTVVIYTSDQGFYMGEHGWFDKRFMYEESFSTPLIMHLPKGLSAKGVIEEMVQNIDLAPTFLDIAGADIPAEIQGESLLPLLRGEKELPSGRDVLYYHFYEYPAEHMVMRHYGVRDDRYKLIHFYNDRDSWELYDLEKDPYEMSNVYDDPAYAEILEGMKTKLVEAQIQYEDTLALSLNGF
ncbi:MAG: sulfatase [Porphyromonas sp.]|nr:sulfatase [Porphyromonas sp.]